MEISGWDVVYACSALAVNEALANTQASTFVPINYSDSEILLKGSFGPWTIIAGGTTGSALLQATAVQCDLTVISTGQIFNISGIGVQVRLYLSAGDPLNLGMTNLTLGATATGVELTKFFANSQPGLSALYLDAVEGAMSTILNSNSKLIEFVIAEIQGSGTVDGLPFTLSSQYYGYQDSLEGGLGYFTVCAMVSGGAPPENAPLIDSNLMQDGLSIGFMMAPAVFLGYVIQPGMPNLFPGTNAIQFTLSNGQITNSGNLTMQPVRVGAIDYPPAIETMAISIIDTNLTSYFSGKCNITGLHDAYIDFSLTQKNEIDYSNGAIVAPLVSNTITHSAHIPSWEKWIGTLTLGLLNIIIEAIQLGMSNALHTRLEHTGLQMADFGAFSVSWQIGNAQTTNIGLEDCFYMRG